MTIITQANMNAMQAKLEDAIADLNSIAWHAGAAADELCGQTGIEPPTLRKLRTMEGLANQARGLAVQIMAECYDLNLPGPVAPSFGNK